MDRQTKLKEKQKDGVITMKEEKKAILREIIQYENSSIRKNQERREEVRRREEEARIKREIDLAEKERKSHEYYERKASNEAAEAKRAEKLVKALEKKEKVITQTQIPITPSHNCTPFHRNGYLN